jgi:hypothetical protein
VIAVYLYDFVWIGAGLVAFGLVLCVGSRPSSLLARVASRASRFALGIDDPEHVNVDPPAH